MNHTPFNQVSPSDLLDNFNGRSLKSIIAFTVLAHSLVLIASSGPFLWNSLFREDSSNLSETERIDLAVKESRAAMRRIAEQYGVKPQDLGSRFATPTAAPKAKPETTPQTDPNPEPIAAPEKPESAIEKEIQKAVPGPTVPSFDDEDLFK